jgi:hypothetical protein
VNDDDDDDVMSEEAYWIIYNVAVGLYAALSFYVEGINEWDDDYALVRLTDLGEYND